MPDLQDQIAGLLAVVQLFEGHVLARAPSESTDTLTAEFRDSAAGVTDPLAAVSDVAQLTKAQSVKLAIAFKPPLDAALATPLLPALAALPGPMFGAYHATAPSPSSPIPALVRAELRRLVLHYYAALRAFLGELRAVAQSKDAGAARLVSTAELWAACDALRDAATTLTPARVLAKKVKLHCDTIADAAAELAEHIDNAGLDEGYTSDEDGVVVVDGPADGAAMDPDTAYKFDRHVARRQKPGRSASEASETSPLEPYKLALEKIPRFLKTAALAFLKSTTPPESYDAVNSLLGSLAAQVDDFVAYSVYEQDTAAAADAAADITASLKSIASLTSSPADEIIAQFNVVI